MKNKLKPLALIGMFCLYAFTSGFRKDEARPVRDIVHYNVIIVPDLSNRLNRIAGLKDGSIVDSILRSIYPRIARFNRATGQKDRYSVILSNTKLGYLYSADLPQMRIDLKQFGNDQRSRIEYLMGRNPGSSLRSDALRFTKEIRKDRNTCKTKNERRRYLVVYERRVGSEPSDATRATDHL